MEQQETSTHDTSEQQQQSEPSAAEASPGAALVDFLQQMLGGSTKVELITLGNRPAEPLKPFDELTDEEKRKRRIDHVWDVNEQIIKNLGNRSSLAILGGMVTVVLRGNGAEDGEPANIMIELLKDEELRQTFQNPEMATSEEFAAAAFGKVVDKAVPLLKAAKERHAAKQAERAQQAESAES